MAPTLYMIDASPPVRAVLITAKALNLQFHEKQVNLIEGEHLKPEYLKLNPQHTVPTLDDNGFVIWDSHAIIAYLATKYGKNSTLLPSEPEKRAVVDQRLHFDSSVLFNRVLNLVRPVFRGLKNKFEPEDLDALKEAYSMLDAMIGGKQWVAGDNLTIADHCLIATISSANVVVPVDAKTWPNVAKWMKKVEALPEYEVNLKGLKLFSDFVKSKVNF